MTSFPNKFRLLAGAVLAGLMALAATAGEVKLNLDANNPAGTVEYSIERKAEGAAWPATPVVVVAGEGTVVGEASRSSGAVTATRSGNVITLSGNFLTGTDAGKTISWNGGTSSVITFVRGPQEAVTSTSGTVAPGQFTVSTDRVQLSDQTALPGRWTYRAAARVPGGTLSAYTNEVTVEVAAFGPGSLQIVDLGGFVNLSTRANVAQNEKVMIGGLVTAGPMRIVARGIGPTLANLNVPNPLANPRLEIRDKQGALVASNDDWVNEPALVDAMQKVFAFNLPVGSKDAAMLIDLPAGQYTAIVSSEDPQSTGIALVEFYAVRL